MNVDLDTVNKNFFMRPCLVGGDACVLIEPHEVGVAKWDKGNLIFRSSIWTTNGKLVSAGFPKFFNWDEDREYTNRRGETVKGSIPIPKPELDGIEMMDKLDGSCLIVSFYKGEIILRTRGTISAEDTLSNGSEISALRAKYKKLFAFFDDEREISQYREVPTSYILEWFSPKNRIVLNYGDEPQLWLIGAISHDDYRLHTQGWLDQLGYALEVPRPERYAPKNLAEIREFIKNLRGKEGGVAYDKNGWPWKFKTLQYLALHYSRGAVNTFDKVIDIWLEYGQPDYQTFFNLLVDKHDWETADYARPSLSKLADAQKRVQDVIAGMDRFVARELAGKPRKVQYELATAAYGNTPRRAMVMTRIEGKPLKNDSIKKLVLQLS